MSLFKELLLSQALFPVPQFLWIRKDVCSCMSFLDRLAWKEVANSEKGVRMGEMGRIQQMSFHLFQKRVVINLWCPTPKPPSLKQKSSMNSRWVWDRPHPVLKNTQLSPSTAPTATPVSECIVDKARTVWCPGIAAISCTFPSPHGSFKGATRWKATALQVVSTHSIN